MVVPAFLIYAEQKQQLIHPAHVSLTGFNSREYESHVDRCGHYTVGNTVRMAEASKNPSKLVVPKSGYENGRECIAKKRNRKIIARCGPLWGIGVVASCPHAKAKLELFEQSRSWNIQSGIEEESKDGKRHA
jgi:hypothetical protein